MKRQDGSDEKINKMVQNRSQKYIPNTRVFTKRELGSNISDGICLRMCVYYLGIAYYSLSTYEQGGEVIDMKLYVPCFPCGTLNEPPIL